MRRAALPVLLLAVVVAGCGGDDATRPVASRPGLTTFHDAARGFTVRFPSAWRRATRSLTPHLADPREILAVGTGRLVVASGGCSHMPTGAMQALGPDDVLLTVLERVRGRAGRRSSTRARHVELGLADRSEAAACIPHLGPRHTYWLDLRDGRRAFYALVAVGSAHAGHRLAQARAVLDSLRFEAR